MHVVSHLYTWYQSYKTVVPQVILNFKWSSNEEKFPHTTRAQAYQIGWLMLWHRGRCPTNWYQGQRSYVWYLKGYKWCYSNNQVMSIKNTRFKCQPSTPNANLCINEKHIFLWKLMTKGERLYKDMKALGEKYKDMKALGVQGYESFGRDWDKEVEFGHGHGQRGSDIKEKR